MSGVGGSADAAVVSRKVDTRRSVETRMWLALINVILTQVARIARYTFTPANQQVSSSSSSSSSSIITTLRPLGSDTNLTVKQLLMQFTLTRMPTKRSFSILEIRFVERGICPSNCPQITNSSYNYDRMHGACTKRPYFHFRTKIWRHHRVPRPRFHLIRVNFGDSRTFKADILLLNICMGFQDLLS